MNETRTVTLKSQIAIDLALRSRMGLMAVPPPARFRSPTSIADCEGLIKDLSAFARKTLPYDELAQICLEALSRHPHTEITILDVLDAVISD